MANVRINATDYTGTYSGINGNRLIQVGPLDLVRSIITVGAQDFGELFRYGIRSMGYYVASAITALVLTENRSGDLAISTLFRSFDSTEIGDASYRFGMAFAKLAAERELRVPWLAHVDKLFKSGVLKLTAGTIERGDLAGLDTSGSWHVFEAKGRSSPPSKTLVTKAKRQAGRITSINGSAPATKSSCITHLYDVPIRIDLRDPDRNELEKHDWEVTRDEFLRAYYRRIVSAIETQGITTEFILDNQFDVASFFGVGATIQIGLLSSIRANPLSAMEVIAGSIASLSQEHLSLEDMSIGLDGVFVRVLGSLVKEKH